ncbi:MAG: heavy metal-associated domain-containing protein, partial [Planctomycetota bacterium]
VTLNVPKMHCSHACYPNVKKSLEKQSDVVSVELAPQKEEGVLDNRQIIMTYKEGYELDDALAVLENAGFGGSSVAE